METATLRILSSSRAIWGSVCFILLLHTARPSAHREAFCTPRGLLHTARPSAHREAFCTPRGLLHTARPSAHREAFCTPRGVRSSVSLVLHKQIGKLFLQRPNL